MTTRYLERFCAHRPATTSRPEELVVSLSPSSRPRAATAALALVIAATSSAATGWADEVVPTTVLAEDANPPVQAHLYDHLATEGIPGTGFDELFARDPFSDDRILPGERCAGAPRGGAGATCIDLAPEGFRFRGSSSRLLDKRSFNIRFDDRIVGEDSFLSYLPEERGQSRLNANAMFTDRSMMRERLAMGDVGDRGATRTPDPSRRAVAQRHAGGALHPRPAGRSEPRPRPRARHRRRVAAQQRHVGA